jgi:hypothetical protein
MQLRDCTTGFVQILARDWAPSLNHHVQKNQLGISILDFGRLREALVRPKWNLLCTVHRSIHRRTMPRVLVPGAHISALSIVLMTQNSFVRKNELKVSTDAGDWVMITIVPWIRIIFSFRVCYFLRTYVFLSYISSDANQYELIVRVRSTN